MTKKITQLPVASALDGSEQLELVQSGSSRQSTAQQIADLATVVGVDFLYTGQSPSTVSVGGIPAGTNLLVLTIVQILQKLLSPYQPPTWAVQLTFSGYAATVERGTTLSGTKSWTWSINSNSGTVLTIDIYDVSASASLLSNTPNDGSQSQAITSRTLTAAGDTQIWKGIAHDTGSVPSDIDSAQLITTARLKGYFGDTATTVTNSATVKGLGNNFFEVPGTQVIVLPTGTTNNIFEICTTKTLVSVTDDDTFDAPIAFDLINTISVQDAAGTNYTVNHYRYTATGPYSPQHHLRATLS